jgi:hypothetical protein
MIPGVVEPFAPILRFDVVVEQSHYCKLWLGRGHSAESKLRINRLAPKPHQVEFAHFAAMWAHILAGNSKEGLAMLSHILVKSFVEPAFASFICHPLQYCKTRNDAACERPSHQPHISVAALFRRVAVHQFLFDFYFGRSADFLDGVEFSLTRSHVAGEGSRIRFWVHSWNHSS